MAQLVISMGIIVDNWWQVSYLMCSGNAYTWHDYMCQCCIVVAM